VGYVRYSSIKKVLLHCGTSAVNLKAELIRNHRNLQSA